MPFYDFRCVACNHRFEELVAYSEKGKVRCPECGGEVRELVSGFAVSGGGGGQPRSSAPAAPRFT